MIVAVTGHRPEDCEEETIVRTKLRVKLQYTPNIDTVIIGMAAGVDLWAADEARILGLEVIAARPWAGHEPRESDAELYQRILDYSVKVVNVSESKEYLGPYMYHKRNEWMVDNATHVMAYWNGKETGGTYACINYAQKVGKPISNIWGNAPF